MNNRQRTVPGQGQPYQGKPDDLSMLLAGSRRAEAEKDEPVVLCKPPLRVKIVREKDRKSGEKTGKELRTVKTIKKNYK